MHRWLCIPRRVCYTIYDAGKRRRCTISTTGLKTTNDVPHKMEISMKKCKLQVQYKKGEKGYKDLKIQMNLVWNIHIPKVSVLIRKIMKGICNADARL